MQDPYHSEATRSNGSAHDVRPHGLCSSGCSSSWAHSRQIWKEDCDCYAQGQCVFYLWLDPNDMFDEIPANWLQYILIVPRACLSHSSNMDPIFDWSTWADRWKL